MSLYPKRTGLVKVAGAAGTTPILEAECVHYQASPAAASPAAVHAAITLPTTGTTTVTTALTNPDVPRNVVVKGNAAGITGNVVITGTDAAGAALTEMIVASGSGTVVGNKAFKTVTQVVVPVRTQAGDTISIGTGSKLGLVHKLPHDTVLAAYLNNTREGTAPTVAVSASVLASNTALLNSALNGQVVDLYYLAP